MIASRLLGIFCLAVEQKAVQIVLHTATLLPLGPPSPLQPIYSKSCSVQLPGTPANQACPSHHQPPTSNPRHLDLGRQAFKQLATESWGVIGLKWRSVDCSKLGTTGYLNSYAPQQSSNNNYNQGNTNYQPQASTSGGSGSSGSGSISYNSGGSNSYNSPIWGHSQQSSGSSGGDVLSMVKGYMSRWRGL